jgi:hypothetical protein
MRALAYWALGGVLLGSAFGQVYSATLHVRYGEPTQEVFTVRPGYHMTVVYGSEHQACRLDISSGQSDSFESSKGTNQVLDEIVEELVPESTRGPVKDDGTMYTGFGGQRITTYESLTIGHTELLSPATGVLRTVVTFKHKGCNGVMEPKQRAFQ